MEVDEKELGLRDAISEYEDFMRTLYKINERVTFILLNIKEKRDITITDEELLKSLHKGWYLGEFPDSYYEKSQ